MIRTFCDWLAGTPLSIALGSTPWIVPLVQTLHILLIAAVMASVLLFDLRLLGAGGRNQTIAEAARRFLPTMGIALPGLALSGAILIVAEPARELTNPAFFAKMLLLAAVVAMTLWVGRRLRPDRPPWRGGTARWVGAASLVLWIGVVVAGRWIAYMQDL